MARTRDEITINGSDLLCSLRIGIKMPRMFGPRMTVATCLFRLVGVVSGTNVVVEVDDHLADDPLPELIPDCSNPYGEGIRTTGSGDRPPKQRR